MSNPVFLREFKSHELLFDVAETRAALKFTFESKVDAVHGNLAWC